MVGLCLSCSEHNLCTLLFGLGKEKLQLADFIASKSNACEVISFDKNIGIEYFADVIQPLNRRGKYAKGNSREFI